jgi:sporulation protein YlmC with PRC-barrel domain
VAYRIPFSHYYYEGSIMAEKITQPGIVGTPDPHDGPGPRIMAADSLTGDKVVNERGDELGTITHIMLDVVQGTIAYAVLSFGGVLGLGDKLFAVPWHSLALDIENKWFILNIESERLRDAPGFDKDHWPSMADPRWTSEVHAYYGPVAPSRRPFI